MAISKDIMQEKTHSLWINPIPIHCFTCSQLCLITILQKNWTKSGFKSYWSCKSTNVLQCHKSSDSNQDKLKHCLRIHQKGIYRTFNTADAALAPWDLNIVLESCSKITFSFPLMVLLLRQSLQMHTMDAPYNNDVFIQWCAVYV